MNATQVRIAAIPRPFCASVRANLLQRRAANQAETAVAPPIVYDVLRSPGQPLDAATRAFMEPRFGCDFSQVRVHTDARAAESARAVGALAYTVGRDVVFGEGRYAPESQAAQKLLAHELTHTIQQQGASGGAHANWGMTYPDDAAEREARTAAGAALKGQFFALTPVGTMQVARDGDAGVPLPGGVPQPPPPAPTPTPAPAPTAAIIIDQPTANARFNIDATPAMPTIGCRARITGLTPDPTPTTEFAWQIQITETVTPQGCASSQIGNCSTIVESNVRGGSWTPVIDTIQGGQAVITAAASVGGTALSTSVTVDIRGTNPGAPRVIAACGGAGSDAARIACHETGGSYMQFTDDGTPLLGRGGAGGDVGIMQLCNPPATCPGRWNWRENVGSGIRLLNRRRDIARGYLDRHIENGIYPNTLNLNDENVLQREAFQKYHSGAGGVYWIWDDGLHQWIRNPTDAYVANLLSQC